MNDTGGSHNHNYNFYKRYEMKKINLKKSGRSKLKKLIIIIFDNKFQKITKSFIIAKKT